LSNENGRTSPNSDVDVQTHLNTQFNQLQSKQSALNVFERLYRGATNNGSSNSNGQQINSGNVSDSESAVSNRGGCGPTITIQQQQQLKKNISLSTASLSSSTSGSNNTAGVSPTQSTINDDNNKKDIPNNNQIKQQQQNKSTNRTNVFERLTSSITKSPKTNHLKSNNNLTNEINHVNNQKTSSPTSPVLLKRMNDNFIDSKSLAGNIDLQSVWSDSENQVKSMSTIISNNNNNKTDKSSYKKTSFTNRIKGLFRKS
jgi:hypothetical protein